MSACRSRLIRRVSAPAAAFGALLTLLPATQSRASEPPNSSRLVASRPASVPPAAAVTPGEQARVMTSVRDAWVDFLKRHSDFGGAGTSRDISAYNVSIEKQEGVYQVTLWPKNAETREVNTEEGTQTESDMTVFYFDVSRRTFASIRMRGRHVTETLPTFGTSPAPQTPSS